MCFNAEPPIEPELVVLEVTGEQGLSLKIVHSMRGSKPISLLEQCDVKAAAVDKQPNLYGTSSLIIQPLLLSSEPWPGLDECKCPMDSSAWFHPRKLLQQTPLMPTRSSFTSKLDPESTVNNNNNNNSMSCADTVGQEHDRKVKQFDKLISDQFRRFQEFSNNNSWSGVKSLWLKRNATSPCAIYKRRFSPSDEQQQQQQHQQQQHHYAIKASKFPLNQQSLAYLLLSGDLTNCKGFNSNVFYDCHTTNTMCTDVPSKTTTREANLNENCQLFAMQNAFDSFELEDFLEGATSELEDEFDSQQNRQSHGSAHNKVSGQTNNNTNYNTSLNGKIRDHKRDNCELGEGRDAIITKYLGELAATTFYLLIQRVCSQRQLE